MLADKLTIRFIYFASLVFAIASLSAFIVIFAVEYTRLQDQSITKEFANITENQARTIDFQIAHARRNLLRLKDYINILDLTQAAAALPYLRQVMAKNISFEPDEYNCYFAFEKPLARKYFNQDGFVYTVHKKYADLNKPGYGLTENSIAEVWHDPAYQSNQKEVWYHIAKKSKHMEITHPYFDESFMKQWMFSVALGLYDEKDRFVGMVGIDILLDGIFNDIEKLKVGETGQVLLVHRQNGMVLTRTDESLKEGLVYSIERFKNNLYTTASDKNTWQPILTANTQETTMHGRDRSAYVVSTRLLQELPWTIVVFQSQSELKQALRQSIFWFAVIGGLLLIAVGIFAYILAKSITTPIRGLVGSMNKIKGTQVAGVWAPVTGIAETRMMGEIFNKMIASISEAVAEKEKYYTQLEEINQTLEQKVEERTAELREKKYQIESAMQKLKETQEQLIVKEKLASLGTLTAGIAHEIQNPLNFVNNFSELSCDLVSELKQVMEEKFNPEEELFDEATTIFSDLELNLRKINEHGKRADSIVKNMLLLSRGQSSEKRSVNINALLDEYTGLAYHGMRATCSGFNVSIEKKYADDLPPIVLVAQNIGRAFLNILNNAFYAVHQKTKTTEADYVPSITLATRDGGNGIIISIRDNGTGMAENVVEKIFMPFFTKKPTGSGTGLGLAITHDIIVVEHRGEIKVETKENEFSEFIITLPRLAEMA
jgi:signal transduction histidine kinase